MKAQETMDAELVALAALVFAKAVELKSENDMRKMHGSPPNYITVEHADKLEEKLRERGVVS